MNVAVLMVEKLEVIVHDYQEIVLVLYVPYHWWLRYCRYDEGESVPDNPIQVPYVSR